MEKDYFTHAVLRAWIALARDEEIKPSLEHEIIIETEEGKEFKELFKAMFPNMPTTYVHKTYRFPVAFLKRMKTFGYDTKQVVAKKLVPVPSELTNRLIAEKLRLQFGTHRPVDGLKSNYELDLREMWGEGIKPIYEDSMIVGLEQVTNSQLSQGKV